MTRDTQSTAKRAPRRPRPTKPAKPAKPRRVSNWAGVFARFIEEQRNAAFAWGSHDCCLFACNGVRALTGLDPAAKVFRGKYCAAAGALGLVRKHGGIEAIAEKQCAACGFAELPTVALAQRGDVVLRDVPDDVMRCAVGLCVGALAAFVAREGLIFVPLAQCRRAWRVA